MLKLFKKSILLIDAVAILAMVKVALAITDDPYSRLDRTAQEAKYNIFSKASFAEVLVVIIEYALGFIGVVFVALIILAGFRWMTSGGNEEKVTKARDNLKNAVIGLLIILAAYSVTYFIGQVLIKSTTSGYYSYPP